MTTTHERIPVFRNCYSPKTSQAGAVFNRDVTVCADCRQVYHSLPAGSRCRGTTGRLVLRRDVMDRETLHRWRRSPKLRARLFTEMVQEPCYGKVWHPSAELGWRYLTGEKLP